jgi:hypothetical protein
MDFPQRDIFAVGFGLRQICLIEALEYGQICRNSSPTFGKKSLNVAESPFL